MLILFEDFNLPFLSIYILFEPFLTTSTYTDVSELLLQVGSVLFKSIIKLETKIPTINNNKPNPIETKDLLINMDVQITKYE